MVQRRSSAASAQARTAFVSNHLHALHVPEPSKCLLQELRLHSRRGWCLNRRDDYMDQWPCSRSLHTSAALPQTTKSLLSGGSSTALRL